MRPLRLVTGWLLGAAVYTAVGLAFLLAGVAIALAAVGDGLTAGDQGASVGAMAALTALVVVTPVLAGALAGLVACATYPRHPGMAPWKWSVVALGGPALLWLILTVVAQATGGIEAQLQVNGETYTSPVLGILAAVLAVASPVVTGVLVGRVKGRRAQAPTAPADGADPADVGPADMAGPADAASAAVPEHQVVETVPAAAAEPEPAPRRDTVAVVGGAVVAVLLVGTAVVTAAPTLFAPGVPDGYERVTAGTVTVDVPADLDETGMLSPTWTSSWSSPTDAEDLQQIAVADDPQEGFTDLYVDDMTANVPTFEVLTESDDVLTFAYTGADGADYHGVLRVADQFAVLATAHADVPLDGLQTSVDSAR